MDGLFSQLFHVLCVWFNRWRAHKLYSVIVIGSNQISTMKLLLINNNYFDDWATCLCEHGVFSIRPMSHLLCKHYCMDYHKTHNSTITLRMGEKMKIKTFRDEIEGNGITSIFFSSLRFVSISFSLFFSHFHRCFHLCVPSTFVRLLLWIHVYYTFNK